MLVWPPNSQDLTIKHLRVVVEKPLGLKASAADVLVVDAIRQIQRSTESMLQQVRAAFMTRGGSTQYKTDGCL